MTTMQPSPEPEAKAGVLRTAWQGDFGLARTWWLLYFLPNATFYIAASLVPGEPNFLLLYLVVLANLAWTSFTLVCVWRASDESKGSERVWRIAARAGALIGWAAIALIILGLTV